MNGGLMCGSLCQVLHVGYYPHNPGMEVLVFVTSISQMGKLELKKGKVVCLQLKLLFDARPGPWASLLSLEAQAGAGEQKAKSICISLCICLWNFQSTVFWLFFFFIYPSPLAFKFTFLGRYLLCFPLLQTGNCKNFDKWNDWCIFFVFSLFFQHPLRKCESSFWAHPALSDIRILYIDTPPTQRGSLPSLKYTPCQTRCPAQCAKPALALFTWILIGPPAWEWTSKNGFSRSLWITFYSSGFPTVLFRGKKPGKLAMVKRCEISLIGSRIPCASLRKWAAVLAVKWLPAWDGVVRLALNFWNPDKASGRSLWKAQVGFTILSFTDHNRFNNLCLAKEQHFRAN